MFEFNKEFRRRLKKIDSSKEFFDYLKKPLKKSIRINTLKADATEVLRKLEKLYELEKIPWCEHGFYINTENAGNTLEHKLGLIFSQEASSMIPATVMELKPGMLVLDMAASPGAKTTQIAQYMENEGCIVANDVKKSRINILISNLQRCGVLIAKVTLRDGRSFSKFESTFDAVLLDAPCSNTGMIRKNFKYAAIWRKREVETLSRLQKDLISSAYRSLKLGGVMVYSTCSLDPEENEGVVDYLLSNTEAEIEKIELPVRKHTPFLKFDGKKFDRQVKNCLRIHPQDNDTGGFFVAKVIK
ncbi:MAG TPA: NOL1/NOP2/sun family putative RNA methylase [Archaeoglobaceae archaeon]|nr:NOL1/NOP2/sun family putative RNA methylase [Archaeoglobaceae archaeon]